MDTRRQLYWQLSDASQAEIATRIENHRARTKRIQAGSKRRASPKLATPVSSHRGEGCAGQCRK